MNKQVLCKKCGGSRFYVYESYVYKMESSEAEEMALDNVGPSRGDGGIDEVVCQDCETLYPLENIDRYNW